LRPPHRRPPPLHSFPTRRSSDLIHPAKLFADISTALVAIDLFWRHELVPGLIIAVLPPVLVSAVLIREGDLERYRASPMGAYLRSEEHTSELQSRSDLVCRLLLE